MTKNIFITNLKEVQGIKIICKKCKSFFMVPVGQGTPPGSCIMCRKDFESEYLADALMTIQRLASYCEKNGYEAVIETEEGPKPT